MAEWMELEDETWFARISSEGDPDLPPVIMIHGLIVSGTYFRPVAAHLDHRYRVYVPDLPGYGRSPSKRIWSVPSIASRLADWMDAHGLCASVLVGNSLGCQIATQLAVTRPDLVAGLVLVGPTVDPAARSIPRIVLRGVRDVPNEQQSIWAVWIPDFFRAGPRRGLRMLHECVRDDQLSRLHKVTQPTLIIGGGKDPISPPGWIRDMAGRMPRARPLVLPESPHAMNYSRPRELARAIDTVIQGWEGNEEQ